MNSMTLRRLFISPIVAVAMAALALVTGEAGRSAKAASRPNAKIMLRNVRDVRQGESRLLAERLGSDRLELCLLGVDVRVERDSDDWILYGRQNAVIGKLVRLDSGEASLFRCDAPGMGQLAYALDR